MDLSTIETKIKNNQYKEEEEVNKDINLVWENAILFNEQESDIYHMAV